ncbi:hypothetical protein [uncultured Algimonas sp.]|uniref:hypothetical protein n=1 Tax=uncultured Algimonas sp. TaxID=1547920 RepID=UPI00262B66BF|nr:hypothetical protein [uncultured Algimonas sp.]
MRNLSLAEMSSVSGGGGCSDSDGLFEAMGCAADNPFTAIGEAIDIGIEALSDWHDDWNDMFDKMMGTGKWARNADEDKSE